MAFRCSLTPTSCDSPLAHSAPANICLLCFLNSQTPFSFVWLLPTVKNLFPWGSRQDGTHLLHIFAPISASPDHLMEHCCLPTCPPAHLTSTPCSSSLSHALHSSNRCRLYRVVLFSTCCLPPNISSVKTETLFALYTECHLTHTRYPVNICGNNICDTNKARK